MKHEEEKLKQKYPNMKAGVGGSALLSKRLQKVGKGLNVIMQKA